MLDKVYIKQHCAALKLKAAQKYNIAPEKCHIGHLLLQGMLERPHALSQIDAATDTSESNASVARRSARLADAMRRSGLRPGDAVVVMGVNHLDVVIPYYACHYNGHSVCPIDPNIAPSDLQRIFPFIQPKIVFCQEDCVEKVRNAFEANNLQGEIVTFNSKYNDLECFILQYKGTEVNYRPAEFDHTKINAWLMLTSGTTGLPKVAMIPYETLINGICSWWQPHSKRYDKILSMASLQWISSQIFFITTPLRSFTRVQSSTPITGPALVGIINKYKPNATAWTPFFMNQFIVAGEAGLVDLTCFHYILVGGGRIEKPLLERFKKLCPSTWFYLAYGMTELVVPIFDFDDSAPTDSAGYPMEKYQYRLMDNNNNIVTKPYDTGDLWVKGDDFFKGYLNNPEETKKMLTDDGWLKTGDIFYRDDRGFYFFVERKRLLIKYSGMLIAPSKMEEVIKQHPGVLEACVVGVPDPNAMEVPTAVIQRRNGDEVHPGEIFALLNKVIPQYKLAGGLFFVDSFPVTPSGKIIISKLLEIARNTKTIMPN